MFFILTIQLIVTAAFAAPFIVLDEVKDYMEEHYYLVFVALAITVVLSIVLACCTRVARSSPMNYILLGIYTIAEAFLVGVCGARFDPMYVIYAVGTTFAIVLVITIFAVQVRYDFTTCTGLALVISVVLLIMGIVAIFYYDYIFILVYSSLGVVAFSFFMVIDIQMIMGGKHAYVFSPQDYVIAALHLYIDIIAIFQYLLQIFGNAC